MFSKMKPMFAQKKQDESFAPYLPYLACSDHTLINVDGSMAQGLSVQGLDVHCLTQRDLGRLSDAIRMLVDQLPVGYELQVHFESKVQTGKTHPSVQPFLSKRSRENRFVEKLNQSKLEQLVKDAGQETKITVFCVVPGKKEEKKAFQKWFGQTPALSWNESFIRVRRFCESVASSLSGLGCLTRYLLDQEFMQFLYEVLNPRRSCLLPFAGVEHRLRERGSETSLRSSLWFSGMTVGRTYLYFDETYVRTLTIKSLPESTFAGMVLPLLEELKGNYRLSFRLQIPDQGKEITLNELRRNVSNVFLHLSGDKRNVEAEATHESAEGALEEMVKRGQRLYLVSMTLHLFAESLEGLDEISDQALLAFRKVGNTEAMIEEYGQDQAFLSSLPGTTAELCRPIRLLSSNVGDLFPIYQRWKGSKDPEALLHNDLGQLVSWNLFDRTHLENYNAIVVGASGTGKSFAVSFLTQSYAAQGYPVWFIDVGGSYKRLVEGLGGQYIPLNLTTSLNPFSTIHQQTSILAFPKLEQLLGSLIDDGKKDLTQPEKMILHRALKALLSQNKKEPLLQDFVEILEKDEGADSRSLARRFRYWTDGPYAHLVNRPTNLAPQSKVVAFDLKDLHGEGRRVGLLLLTALVEDMAQLWPQPKIVIFDECWSLLHAGAELIESLYRTGRKQNLSVISVTQSFRDFLDCPISSAILSNSAVRYVLPVCEGEELLCEHLHLNEREQYLLRKLRQVKGEYSELLVQFSSKHLILRIKPSPLEYWVATTHPPDLEEEQKLSQTKLHTTKLDLLLELAERFPKGVTPS